jgi:hypothetical protein
LEHKNKDRKIEDYRPDYCMSTYRAVYQCLICQLGFYSALAFQDHSKGHLNEKSSDQKIETKKSLPPPPKGNTTPNVYIGINEQYEANRRAHLRGCNLVCYYVSTIIFFSPLTLIYPVVLIFSHP